MTQSNDLSTTGFSRFITISSDPRKASQNANSRRNIRANAARFARSDKARSSADERSAHTSAVNLNAGSASRLIFSSKQKPRVRSLRTCRRPSPRRRHSISLKYGDPFITAGSSEVAHYFKTSFRVGSWPESFKKEWFQFMADDLVMTNATLSFVSLSYDSEGGGHVSSQTLCYRAETLKQVSKQICSEELCTNDRLIGAVALLSIAAGLEGDFRASFIHMRALTVLVNKHGGFEKISSTPPLYRVVTWAFICHSSTFSTTSPLNPRSDVQTHRSFAECCDLYTKVMKTLARKPNFFEEVLFPEMFYLIQLLSSTETGSVHPSRQDTLKPANSLLIYIEQYLLSADSSHSTKSLASMDVLATILAFATQLYCSIILQNMCISCGTVLARVERLQEALNDFAKLSKSDDNNFGETSLLVQLWSYVVLFSANADAVLSNISGCVFAEIRELVQRLNVGNLDDLKDSLARISWVKPSFREVELRTLLELCHQ